MRHQILGERVTLSAWVTLVTLGGAIRGSMMMFLGLILS
jgi:hypothetical protein